MIELKPCPFCGKKAVTRVETDRELSSVPGLLDEYILVSVDCFKCDTHKIRKIKVKNTDFNEVITAMQAVVNEWNTRT